MLAARLPKILAALEQRQEPVSTPRASGWPLALSALALALAMTALFT